MKQPFHQLTSFQSRTLREVVPSKFPLAFFKNIVTILFQDIYNIILHVWQQVNKKQKTPMNFARNLILKNFWLEISSQSWLTLSLFSRGKVIFIFRQNPRKLIWWEGGITDFVSFIINPALESNWEVSLALFEHSSKEFPINQESSR